ncbi:MAG: GH-E family nuclease [Lachnospiraceae bacterium]
MPATKVVNPSVTYNPPDTPPESGKNTGYYKDANGRWHRPNGQFASNTEVGLPSNSKHYLHRPYIRQETIDAVNAKTKVNYKTGQIYDEISDMWVDPSNVELGHTTGHEFAFYRDMAESQGWTQAQFNDFMNNPKFYAWQDIYSNRSHMFEAKH